MRHERNMPKILLFKILFPILKIFFVSASAQVIKIRKEIKLDHWYSLELMKKLDIFRIIDGKLDNNVILPSKTFSLNTVYPPLR